MVSAANAAAVLSYPRQRVPCYNLGQPELVNRFTHNPNQQRQQQQALAQNNQQWLAWHPQLLIQPQGQLVRVLQAGGVRWDEYDSQVGFIGLAENLIRLTPQQLGVRIPVEGVPGGFCCL